MSVILHHVVHTVNAGRLMKMLFVVVYQILSGHLQIVNQSALLVQTALRTKAVRIKNVSILVSMHAEATPDVL